MLFGVVRIVLQVGLFLLFARKAQPNGMEELFPVVGVDIILCPGKRKTRTTTLANRRREKCQMGRIRLRIRSGRTSTNYRSFSTLF
ncbi:hypothetical protein TNIN_235031 [Trichonephila inaurata madagascariensis]|uniref:Secreted protein n=1 Tax=Trichonephila inaurata madagascariensis TaxID=2747483 RepID=A0A8X6IC27_9ARAC|nr:hypothetical protein TNIN_235031 [Trichonephila inaurata madagascariensis]